MVHSPMYKRLMRFVEDAKANETLSDYDSKHSSTLDAIREAEERIQHFREYQGFQGQTGDAINKWLEDAERRVRLWRASYLATSQVEVEMRRVMKHAREEAEMLSPVLVDARLDKLRDVAEVTIPVMEQYGLVGMAYNAVASTGAAVYDAIAAQANNQREASSTDILQRLNDSMQGLANNAARIKELQEELKDSNKIWDPGDLPQPSNPSVADQLEKGIKDVSSHDPGVYPGNRDTDYGRSDLRGPNSGLYPNGFDDPTAQDADAEKLRKLQSGRIPDKFNKDGELGSRSKPITDPEDLMGIDLLHSRIGGERYANGTVGGYTPAPPNDRHHPLWNINGGRKMESIRKEITLDNKLTYHGVPILITRQLNKLVGYDISLKLSTVKGRSVLRNEEIKALKRENAILSNQLTYTAIYYEKNLKELLQKIKELRAFKDEITEYFISNEIETRLQQDSNNIEIALKLLDNITDTSVKERISIGILEKMGY